MTNFTVDKSLAGKSLKEYFEMQNFSTAQIKRLKYDGQILANGSVVTVRYVLREGDVITLNTAKKNTPTFSEHKADVLWQDEFLYVANKPHGIAIHPDKAHKTDTLGNRLATTFGQGFELRIVTRLDKTTSGLVLGAFDEVTAQRLNELQLEHKISKQYVACVEGEMSSTSGTIDLSLLRVDSQNKTVVDKTGKRSVTNFEVLSQSELSEESGAHVAQTDTNSLRVEVGSKLLVTPLTGRTHQIRAHLAATGHPIVGDTLYGAQPAERVMLHCARLTFVHPVTGQTVDVTCPPEF